MFKLYIMYMFICASLQLERTVLNVKNISILDQSYSRTLCVSLSVCQSVSHPCVIKYYLLSSLSLPSLPSPSLSFSM